MTVSCVWHCPQLFNYKQNISPLWNGMVGLRGTSVSEGWRQQIIIIIIMYVYHALINALSSHMIHINLNMIFYTHVEHSPTKTIYIKYYIFFFFKCTINAHTRTHARTHARTHTDCGRNWVLILVRMEILWEEVGFQFGFKNSSLKTAVF